MKKIKQYNKLHTADFSLAMLMAVGVGIVSAWATWLAKPWALPISLAALAGAISLLVLFCFRYWPSLPFRQVESLIGLSSVLRPRKPLPAMRGMAISPDFAVLILDTIITEGARTIVELGCGCSTIVCGYALENLGGGELTSIDHHERFASICMTNVRAHQLESVVRVQHCPLVDQTIDGKPYRYYDFSRANLPDDIDLLIIDGPPEWIQKQARYPALPLLISRLRPGAVILVDDAGRADESQAVERWLREFSGLVLDRWVEAEKGAVVLRYAGNQMGADTDVPEQV